MGGRRGRVSGGKKVGRGEWEERREVNEVEWEEKQVSNLKVHDFHHLVR